MKAKQLLFWKYTYTILLLINFVHLAGMVPNVTKLDRMPAEEKRKVIAIYKDFCNERVQKNTQWTMVSLFGLGATIKSKSLLPKIFAQNIAQNKIFWPSLVAMASLFAIRQTYFLGRNKHRDLIAQKENVNYLNHDVLEQLGNPPVSPCGRSEVMYLKEYTPEFRKDTCGRYTSEKRTSFDHFSLDDANGIAKALTGKYYAWHIKT